MSKIKLLLLCGLIIAILPLSANNYKPEKRIYLMDLSGSMTGLGSVRTDNVLDKMKADLKGTINWVPTNTDFVFIPFTEEISPYIQGTSEEKPVLIGHISNIDIMPGNTDIASAWERGLAELDSTKVNYLFLLSDGYHNRGISKQEFYSTLHNWSNDNSNYDVEAYFVLLSPQYRTTEVAKIFDSTDRMQVVESMNIIRQTASAEADTTQISTTVPPVSSTSDKAFSWCWLWIVLIILIIILAIALLIYLIAKYGPVTKTLATPKLGNPVNHQNAPVRDNRPKEKKNPPKIWEKYQKSRTIHDGCITLIDLIDKLKEIRDKNPILYQDIIEHMPKGIKNDVFQIEDKYKVPNRYGQWSGERGNSNFILDPDAMLNFPDGRPPISIRDLISLFKQDFGISIPYRIPYRNRRVDLSCMSVASVKINYEDSDLSQLKGRGAGHGVQNIAKPKFESRYKNLMNKLGYDNYSDFKDGKDHQGNFNRQTPLVPHEDYDGQTIMLVPMLLHNILRHYGGIALADIVVHSTGRDCGPLV